MNFKLRKAQDRGTADHGWLHAKFTFSFANYYDPEHCGFHSLVVMNNDIIEPGGGFGKHPHENAEIFTYVISGQLEHQDSMGNGSIIYPGNLQYMSAGEGVYHSEYNPSDNEQVELYQIWMLPNQKGGKPRYEEKQLGNDTIRNGIKVLFSEDGRNDSTSIRQNAIFSFGHIEKEERLEISQDINHPNVWIQIISGSCEIDDFSLQKADGLGIENVKKDLEVNPLEDCKFFLLHPSYYLTEHRSILLSSY